MPQNYLHKVISLVPISSFLHFQFPFNIEHALCAEMCLCTCCGPVMSIF